jgi:hypothetical protein
MTFSMSFSAIRVIYSRKDAVPTSLLLDRTSLEDVEISFYCAYKDNVSASFNKNVVLHSTIILQ